MMVKHIWTVLCERVSQDHTGNSSHLTCLEAINVTGLPIHVGALSLSSSWFNGGSKEAIVKFKIELVKPDNSSEFLGDKAIEAPISSMSSHRANLILDGMPVEQFGTYWFRVHSCIAKKTELVAELPLVVNKVVVQAPQKKK